MQITLSIDETCLATGLGRTKLYEIIGQGRLPAKKLGKRTLILKTDLESFLNNLDAYPSQGEMHHG